jgi:hypothetical protein
MHCKTCKHFARGGEYRWHRCDDGLKQVVEIDPSARTGLCLHSAMQCDYVASWTTHLADDQELECTHDGICASCDEGRGTLCVGEDFGCIHHETGQHEAV